MGNKLCRKKGDEVDCSSNKAPPSKFDRIVNRLHLRPAKWKSESHLNKKGSGGSKVEDNNIKNNGESIFYTNKPLSKSSDWTDVDLEVPSQDEHLHLPNPKLNLIFDNEKGTPTPPPRHKQQKSTSNFRERIERMATKGLQALQGDKHKKPPSPVPVEEPLMVKKTINYVCPICESDEKNHNRDHHHHHSVAKPISSNKRQKNLSVVSLPNYTDLKLSVAQPKDLSKGEINTSRLSLQQPGPNKKVHSNGKLDSYITRCRSLGSILPQQLKKLRAQKIKPDDHVTSDDSFGPLEDWDVGLIEHYNPKDASLPRPRKPVSDRQVLEDIESLVVKNEDIAPQPQRPLRRSESLVKKKEDVKAETKPPEDICLTPPPSPVQENITIGQGKKVAALTRNFENSSATVVKRDHHHKEVATDQSQRASVCEHSTLMKILQEFSVKDTQEKAAAASTVSPVQQQESDKSSLTPSLGEFEKNVSKGNSTLEDFIKAEKKHSETVCS